MSFDKTEEFWGIHKGQRDNSEVLTKVSFGVEV